ncbi:hypothetical protein FRB97_000732 [Tulasnella sp. 331]|nr:hypothetical protein FRB97_000732 [Tulasnella sp. 331]KAG8886911.1 hypothetical protein FRB98_000786 [Tulasnella sp. 332]
MSMQKHNPQDHTPHPPHHVPHRVGGWMPHDQRVLNAWLGRQIAKVNESVKTYAQLHPVVQEFKVLIERDSEIFMGFHQMFEQVPTKPPYNNDPTGKPQIRDYMTMLRLFDMIIGTAPDFENNDLVGFPINAILDWPMGTPGGFTAFINPKVNAQFKKMFDVWAKFLGSQESRYVLNSEDNGWFGPTASAAMPGFTEMFICEPDAEYMGFRSWDDFFTRQFRPGVRPVLFPDNDAIVNSACESTIYCIAHDVKERDTFWLKGEPYSLSHMLNQDPYAPQFAGGTVYQAFLSALNFHRWVSPVNGTVRKVVYVPGTYYAESPVVGFDEAGPNLSQGFITAIAARAMIFIEADNPAIGLMCFMAVGMAEVSTCDVTVKEGEKIKKGQETGMFHFGGSTHCLIFRRQTKVTFNPDYPVGSAVPLNAAIATIG